MLEERSSRRILEREKGVSTTEGGCITTEQSIDIVSDILSHGLGVLLLLLLNWSSWYAICGLILEGRDGLGFGIIGLAFSSKDQ